MWEHTLVTTTDVPAADLWAVAADAGNWPAWRPGVDAAEPTPDPRTVRVRGNGRWSRVAVESAEPPARLVLTTNRYLRRTRTEFAFTPTPRGTVVRVGVQVGGLSGLFWMDDDSRDRELATLVHSLVARAKAARPAVTA